MLRERLGRREQLEQHLPRVELRPHLRRVRPHRRRPRDRVLHPVVRRVAAALHRQQHVVRQPLRQHLPGRLVADRPLAQLLQHLGHRVRGHPPLAGPARHHERLGRRPDLRPDRAFQDRGEPGVALEDGRRRRVPSADRTAAADQLLGRRMPDLDLAERGQHGADVVEERPVRTHDEDPGPQQPVAERVQQPGRPVQPDRGLAGTRRTLHAYRRPGVGADDLVLLRLDRGDDVAHRADARALDLVDEDLAAPDVARLGRDEVLVLVGGEPAVVHAEPAPEPHPHRLPARGPVERAGQLGAPVDDDRVAQLVVDVPPADVPALLAVLLVACRSSRPKNSAVVGSSTSPAARRARVMARNSSETRSPPDARADRVFSRIRASSRRAFSRYACSPASSSVTTVFSGMRKGPSTGGAPSGETRQCTCGRPLRGNRFREPGKGETGFLTLSRDGRRG